MIGRRAAWAATLFLSLGGACFGRTVFVCAGDDECRIDGVDGVCQADGFCSFPDESCASGQRYGRHAGDGKSHACVPVDAVDGSTSGADPDSDAGTDSTSTSTGSMTVTTTSSTTLAEGSSTGDPDDASTGSVEPTSSTGTEEPPPCLFEDDFEADAIDPSWTVFGDLAVEQSEGLLQIPLPADTGYALGGVRRSEDLSDAVITITVASVPDPVGNGALAIRMTRMGIGHLLTIASGELVLSTYAGTLLASEPFDLDAHRHLRFVVQQLSLSVATSGNGEDWLPLWDGPLEIAPDDVGVRLFGQTSDDVARVKLGTVAFDRFSICPLP